jgi:hypothetical protein
MIFSSEKIFFRLGELPSGRHRRPLGPCQLASGTFSTKHLPDRFIYYFTLVFSTT